MTRAAARAAEATPGVAGLRSAPAPAPVRAATPARASASGAAPTPRGVRTRTSGVGSDGRPGRHVQLHLAVRDGHRALDVTRAVREAVTEAVRAELGPQPPPVSVAVTVTDIA